MNDEKYQVFVSSTYLDLRDERQACVTGILSAGHIPAGMELFAADDRSQLETIYEWIDESDIFMLLLGGRYGAIDKQAQKSYTQLEYEYAVSKNKPLFAVVLSEKWMNEKVKSAGMDVMETQHSEKLNAFRAGVLERMVRFVSNDAEIKLAIFESVQALARRHSISGWKRSLATAAALEEITRLSQSNEGLRKENEGLRKQAALAKQGTSVDSAARLIDGRSVQDWCRILNEASFNLSDDAPETVLETLIGMGHVLANGVTNAHGQSNWSARLYYGPASHLLSLGLAEHGKVPAKAYYSKIQLSASGKKLVTEIRDHISKNGTTSRSGDVASGSASSMTSTLASGSIAAASSSSEHQSSDRPKANPGARKLPRHRRPKANSPDGQ